MHSKPTDSSSNEKSSIEAAAPSHLDDVSVSKSAATISICVIISRITGFARTWAMAFALGSTFLSSSYQIANNLPSMLYELVLGGVLVTAFLPVYVSVKKKLGTKTSNQYASNLLTLVVITLGIISVLGMIFPQAIIYTQSFYNNQSEMSTAVLLFQFFAIQTVFYGASTIISGVLNANREYFWSAIAPVANNIIVIATFILYVFVAQTNQQLALYIIAIGNPLGVFVQLLVQLPCLSKCGIRLRPHINIRDPHLKETFSLGGPAFIVMLMSFLTVSVMNAAAYAFAENGPSIIVYSRLWYMLPYSFIVIPITTSLFTELSHIYEEDDKDEFVRSIKYGCEQILFMMFPFMFYLIVFSYPLVTMYHIGAFTETNINQIASFLCAMSLGLPFYGICIFFQKVFSSMRKLNLYALLCVIGSIVQVAITMICVELHYTNSFLPIETVAWAAALFYVILDILAFAYLKYKFCHIGLCSIIAAALKGLTLGALGAVCGHLMLTGLQFVFGALNGSVLQAFLYVALSGVVSLLVTFGIAVALKIPEAKFISSIVYKATDKLFKRQI